MERTTRLELATQPWQGCALPTELSPHVDVHFKLTALLTNLTIMAKMVRVKGVEPHAKGARS